MVAALFAVAAVPNSAASPREGCGQPKGGATWSPLIDRAYALKKWRQEDPRTAAQKRRIETHRRCARTDATRRWMVRSARRHRERFQAHRERKLERQELRRAARCGSPSCNRALAQLELRLNGSEWNCADSLYHHESGWEETARNPSSGAYGIPQALPASKMGSAAQGAGWEAARAQLRWGAGYVYDRYGSYCGAMAFWSANGWY